MFTGIVTEVGSIIARGQRNDVLRLSIACRIPAAKLEIGASIACNGICMTIVERNGEEGNDTIFEVDAGPETTWAGHCPGWRFHGQRRSR